MRSHGDCQFVLFLRVVFYRWDVLIGQQVGENSQRETNCGHIESDSSRTALANVAIGTCNGTCKMDLHGSCMTSTIIQQAQVLI